MKNTKNLINEIKTKVLTKSGFLEITRLPEL